MLTRVTDQRERVQELSSAAAILVLLPEFHHYLTAVSRVMITPPITPPIMKGTALTIPSSSSYQSCCLNQRRITGHPLRIALVSDLFTW